MNGLLPVRIDGSVSESGLSKFILRNLTAGTQYVVTLRAVVMSQYISDTVTEAIVVTYGNRKFIIIVHNWHLCMHSHMCTHVSRTLDNKSIVAMWEPLVTTPPAGRVERCEVQYRNLGKELINTLRVNAQFNYFVIAPVKDGNEYEVRVK